jgi:hypothetical protein
MRYCPKDKTYSKSMALTSRLCLAIAIDTVGHSEYYVRLFAAMKLQATELTFSGLRRMWRKKEYGRMRQGRKQVKLDRRIAIRKSILKGIDELEKDKEEGRAYESGIRMAGDDDNENDKQSGEPRAKKRAKTGATKDNNKKEKRTASLSCRCGGQDHKRISSQNCPWKGLSEKEIAEKYAVRINEQEMNEESKQEEANEASTGNDVTSTRDIIIPDPTRVSTADPTGRVGKIVQWTSKFF